MKRKKRVVHVNCQQRKWLRSMLLCVCSFISCGVSDFYAYTKTKTECLTRVYSTNNRQKTPTTPIFWCTQTHERRLMSEKSLTIRIDAVCLITAETEIL